MRKGSIPISRKRVIAPTAVLVMVDEKVQELIHSEAGEQAIDKLIREHTPSIRSDGLSKVLQGVTSLEEVMRVTKES